MRYILGLNSSYHESSACLIKDGQIVAVAEEERFNRKKHAKPARVDNPDELPVNAINFCLKKAGISLKDVDYAGYSLYPKERLERNTQHRHPYRITPGDFGTKEGEEVFYQKNLEAEKKMREMGFEGNFLYLNHHDCHAASSFFVSGFDEAAVLVVDGIGEFESTTLYKGTGNRLRKIQSIDFPNSLGFLWEKISKYMGFGEYDACKVMGLAAYGDPAKYCKKIRSFVKVNCREFNIDEEIVKFRAEDYLRLEKLLGKKRAPKDKIEERHADIAAALQRITEDILLKLADSIRRQTGSSNLCLAGGVALNCVANSALQKKGPFQDIYIQAAAHDAGTAIGAAYFIWNQRLGNPRSYVMYHAYLGPGYSDEQIKRVLERNNLKFKEHKDIERVAARLVSEGNIVGWFQGRMEVGPRALGNRSILADPRNPKVRDLLNMKVKHREYFRPFAPSVLAENAEEWFRIPKKLMSSDFMLFTYDIIEDKRRLIPAVMHVDGTSRVQTVRKETNPRYYRLIQEFQALTGIPAVLNTSFNDQEPIVCSPQDAVDTFLRTRIDYLVIGNFAVSRGRQDE